VHPDARDRRCRALALTERGRATAEQRAVIRLLRKLT
jgi:DNA-binding MarR family transcriptional regulator